MLRLFPAPLRMNGRLLVVGDGIKVPKSGKKMPAVKLLHQESESNTKPQFIWGHSQQALSLLVEAGCSVFAVPLSARIHEGLVWSNRDRRTLLDKMLALVDLVALKQPFYFVADAYYASGKIISGLLAHNNHLVTRVKSNAVAYLRYQRRGPNRRGRPRLYGKKIQLNCLFHNPKTMPRAASPVYGEKGVTIQYRLCDLLWHPARQLVRFVAVSHPTRGSFLLMSTDTSLSAIDIIRVYGLRFKIEHTFKQAIHVIGSFTYRFWMSDMKPLRPHNGNQYLHHESCSYRQHVKRKLHAYHAFIQAGICHGLLQYLAVAFPQLVWNSFGSWLRTIRPGIAPSEFVVANALRRSLPEFLLDSAESYIPAKFIVERQDPDRMEIFTMAA